MSAEGKSVYLPQDMYVPQEMYDHLMSLPEGTDITEYFEFEPEWNLTVRTGPTGAAPGTEGDDEG